MFQYADLHIHSCYSFDSTMRPEQIIKRANRVGLTLIAITDHGEIEGALEVEKLATNKTGIEVIIGEEIGTNMGDIIGLNLTKRIPSGRHIEWRDALSEIDRQGGISVLPHPFRDRPRNTYPVAVEVDIIESWNARSSPAQNRQAFKMAVDLRKPHCNGSDAHFPMEIGKAKNFIDAVKYDMWSIPLTEEKSSKINFYRSCAVKYLKKKGII